MDILQQTNWFAIQAKAYQESSAAAHVAQADLEVFLPRVRQEHMVCGVARIITKPLFVGYFFARFCPLISYEVVRYAHGVLRVVGTNSFPIPLDAEIISAIQDRVQADGLICILPRTFEAGDRVVIKQGPFTGWMGRVERECYANTRISILLEAIEQARVSVEKRWLEKITAP